MKLELLEPVEVNVFGAKVKLEPVRVFVDCQGKRTSLTANSAKRRIEQGLECEVTDAHLAGNIPIVLPSVKVKLFSCATAEANILSVGGREIEFLDKEKRLRITLDLGNGKVFVYGYKGEKEALQRGIELLLKFVGAEVRNTQNKK